MKKISIFSDQLRAVWMLALVAIALVFATPLFLQSSNMLNILLTAAVVALIAAGQTYVIILAEIDLSVGAVLGFSAIITASVMSDHGPVAGLAAGLLVGALAGAINGLLVTKTRMPSFIATLATMSIFAGLTLQFSQGNPVKVTSESFLFLGQGHLLGIPTPIWIMVGATVLFGYILARTRYGRELYATGDNEDAARLAGVNTARVKIMAFMISGVLAAVAGFILTARLGTAQPTAGSGLELSAIAAVIIGGTSLAGGRGALLGTVVGAVLLSMIDNGLNLLNVSPFLQGVVKGAVILFAVYIDRNSGVLMRIFRQPPPSGPKTSAGSLEMGARARTPQIAAITILALLVAGAGVTTVVRANAENGAVGSAKSATLVISTLNNPFFVSVADGAKNEAMKLGMALDVQNANNNDTQSLNQATTALVKKPDVLVLDPTSSEAGGSITVQANQANVPVVAFDRMPDQGKLAAFIGYDAVQAGRNGAKALCDAMGGSGKAAELQGILGTSVARDRSNGFQEGMKKCSGVELVAVQSGDFDRGKSLDVTTNMLQANPSISGIYGANDEMALGAVAAVKSRGLLASIKIVGNDGIGDALDAVKNGEMYATNAESPFALGQAVIKTSHAVAAGETVEESLVLQGKLVTGASVSEFCDYLRDLGDVDTCK
ncbi:MULTISPECIES: substrate-binding domain-containing protein [unclassified Arthrobacter]|uniref:ABC transporter permease/substrate-binding protein n=1 Tax=unclassified Arthrobacter TaxID=235627 RepID=UPI000CE4228A|nr:MULTISPECIES: substrate-binding domain-containing protein [unclassified Arthrobacter]